MNRAFLLFVTCLMLACHQVKDTPQPITSQMAKLEPPPTIVDVEGGCEEGNIMLCDHGVDYKRIAVQPWQQTSLDILADVLAKINDPTVIVQSSGYVRYKLKSTGKEEAWIILGPGSWVAVTAGHNIHMLIVTN